MTYEEKLDFILEKFYENISFYIKETEVFYHLRPYVTKNEFNEFKGRLIADGYLEEDIDDSSLGAYQASFTLKAYKYSITSKGRYLVETGDGYAVKKDEEKKLFKIAENSYRITENSYKIAKDSYAINWWILIISILGLIISILTCLYTFS